MPCMTVTWSKSICVKKERLYDKELKKGNAQELNIANDTVPTQINESLMMGFQYPKKKIFNYSTI